MTLEIYNLQNELLYNNDSFKMKTIETAYLDVNDQKVFETKILPEILCEAGIDVRQSHVYYYIGDADGHTQSLLFIE